MILHNENYTLLIGKQEHAIAYYKLNLQNGDEIKYMILQLNETQNAIVIVQLCDVHENEHSTAIIYKNQPIQNIQINLNEDIILNKNVQFVMMKIHNIQNVYFIEKLVFNKV
jgi:hypothetical protein